MKQSARQAQQTADVFKFNYLKEVVGDDTYHCTSHAEDNATSDEKKWQIVKEDVDGQLFHATNIDGDCDPDFNKAISATSGGADGAYLAALTYWTP